MTPLGGDPADDAGDDAGGARNGDRIQLRALRVVGTHGVLPEERERAQPFELDLDLTVDLALAGVTDRLSDTVDYGAVLERAAAAVSEGCFELLEALAGAVAEQVLALDVRITAVTVHLRKLRPPVPLDVGTVGIRITRRQ